MRAKVIGRIIYKISNLERWSTLQILAWARIRLSTPIQIYAGKTCYFSYNGLNVLFKNDKSLYNFIDYNGPTVEPLLNFVYQPRISGIQDFLNKQKLITEEEILDVTADSPTKIDVLTSGITIYILLLFFSQNKLTRCKFKHINSSCIGII